MTAPEPVEAWGPAVRLETLPVGTRFRLNISERHQRTGRLEDLSPSAATVTVERSVGRTFKTADGSEVTFTNVAERTTWSLATMVEPSLGFLGENGAAGPVEA